MGIFFCPQPALSQPSTPADEAPAPSLEEEILVSGRAVGGLNLTERASAGSRLDLGLLEIAAAVDVIDAETMATRGQASIASAIERLPGVVSGESPAAPSTFSLRGFTRSQVTFLRDGVWIGPTNMVMRPQNTFNLERIELLRGTASALHGQGAVGGVINAVTKKPRGRHDRPVELAASFGRFDTVELGAGAEFELSDRSWLRLTAGHSQSDGYVNDADPRSTNLTASALVRARDSLDLHIGADYLDDRLSKYWGTPLVPIAFAGANEERGVVRTRSGETVDRSVRLTG